MFSTGSGGTSLTQNPIASQSNPTSILINEGITSKTFAVIAIMLGLLALVALIGWFRKKH